MILSAQAIRRCKPVDPFCERTVFEGTTFGLGPAGYDVRVAQGLFLVPGCFVLASTIERFTMPDNLIGIIHDKSTWARGGIAVQNTVIEPGWCGFLTLEITMHGPWECWVPAGCGIAQIVFHLLDEPTEMPYPKNGKYQNQGPGPQGAR
jgi:dCTP deaminase